MRSRTRAGALLFFCAGFACHALGPRIAAQGGQSAGRFALVINDGLGRPVAGAEVRLYAPATVINLSQPASAIVVSDSDGKVEGALTKGGPVHFVVVAPGHELYVGAETELMSGRAVLLKPGRDVVFEIRDSKGPVVGAIEWSPSSRQRVVIDSDARGDGTLRGLPVQQVSVTVRTERRRLQAKIDPKSEHALFSLPVSGTIRGRVVDEAGAPMANTKVTAIRSGFIETETDQTGLFELVDVESGDQHLEFHSPGYRTELIDVRMRESESVELPSVQLTRSSRIKVRLLDASTGEPLRSPRLVEESTNPMGFSVRDIIRPATLRFQTVEGDVVITDVPIGAHQFVVDSPPYARTRLSPVEITVEPAEIDLGAVHLTQGAELRVTVTERSRQPLAGVPVRLDHGPGLSPLTPATAVTNDVGVAIIDRLGQGRYRLRIGGDEVPGGTTTQYEEWFVVDQTGASLDKRVVIGGVTLDVDVYRPEGPLARVPIALLAGRDDTEPAIRGVVVQTPTRLINAPLSRGVRGTTDEKGHAVLEGAPIGAGRLSLTIGTTTWSRAITVGEENRREVVEMPVGTATFYVTDSDTGEPILSQATWQGASGIRVSAVGAFDGAVTLAGLAQEGGSLQVRALGHDALTLPLETPAAIPVQLSLSRSIPTSVICRVVGLDGIPLRDASVELTASDNAAWRRIVVTDGDGNAVFEDVRPGSARVLVRRPGYAPAVLVRVPIRKGPNLVPAITLMRGLRAAITLDQHTGNRATFRIRVTDERGNSIEDGFDDDSAMNIVEGSTVSIGPLAPGSYVLELVGSARSYRQPLRITDHDLDVIVR